mmetsp:Transcript_12185/g.36570  ORF Transcript_12185/g.36570 Transcript_12185/m.36570 type:complete len:176 (-) Transcript_12185:1214-1741(-)
MYGLQAVRRLCTGKQGAGTSLAFIRAAQVHQHGRREPLTTAAASAVMPASRAQDKIILRGLKFFGYHGVFPEETRNGQHFFVDATLCLDVSQASQSDDVKQTVNYAEVYRDIKEIVEGEPQQLIETVAEALAYTILRQHPLVQFAIVRVDKPEAPIDGTFGTVAVEVMRSREELQ